MEITKCKGEETINNTLAICDKRDSCYRYTKEDDQYQSYFAKMPINENGVCIMFWDKSRKIEDIFPWIK